MLWVKLTTLAILINQNELYKSETWLRQCLCEPQPAPFPAMLLAWLQAGVGVHTQEISTSRGQANPSHSANYCWQGTVSQHRRQKLNSSCLKYSLCSETIPKLLQLDIRIVLCRRWDKRNFRHIYDSDTRGDAHCFNKCITCWMLFIYPILGRMCAAKLPPSTSETGTHQSQSFYYTLKFMTSQIKCLLLTFAGLDRKSVV